MYKVILLLLIFISCEKEKKPEAITTSEYKLNGTKKWKMDKHTKTSIHQMQLLFQNTENFGTIDSFNQFGYQFETELDSLIHACTMTGEAHDQLHVFIQKIFEPLESLKSDSSLTQAKKSYLFLKNALVEYDQFFD